MQRRKGHGVHVQDMRTMRQERRRVVIERRIKQGSARKERRRGTFAGKEDNKAGKEKGSITVERKIKQGSAKKERTRGTCAGLEKSRAGKEKVSNKKENKAG